MGTFSASLTGLTPSATYHFRAIAVGDGTSVGVDKSFTTNATSAPVVSTNAASSVATTSATLNGNLASKGTVDNVTVYFEWGLTISYGNTTTPQAKTAIGTLSASLTGLTADTTYHFRAVAVGDGSVVYGDDVTLTTASQADTTAPVISAVNSSDITVSGATITWTTDETATTQVEYGLTTAYGWTETAGSNAVKNHRVDLPDLEASKTYHYRVISKDAANNQAVSADATFTTTTATPPSGGGIPPWARPIIVFAVVGGAVAAYFISTRLAKK
jgi:phosphodiesterase/alkaline phosphatase D-like protein